MKKERYRDGSYFYENFLWCYNIGVINVINNMDINVISLGNRFFFLRVELKIYEYSSFYFLGNDIWFFIVNFWRFEEIEYNSWCNLGVLLCYGCYNFD